MRAWAAALLAGAWLLAAAGVAQERAPIVVTDPSAAGYRIAVQRFAPLGDLDPALVAALRGHVADGLAFSGFFESIPARAFLGPSESRTLASREPVVCPNWRQIGTDGLLQGELGRTADQLRVEYRLVDVAQGCSSMLRKRYTGSDLRRLGHAIADDVVGAFTGRPGVSDTEIAFISDRSGHREVWVMNADGSETRAVTGHASINAFPDWAPVGDAIAYTSYRHRGRPFIFLLTRGARSPGRILRSFQSPAVYRAVFGPDAQELAVVASTDGNSEIFRIGRNGAGVRRLTRNRAIDVSPTWSPDGRRIAFVSDRTGSPQIYVMDADGSDTRRITFDGVYNTAPAWSPDGKWIAYESRVRSQFDIWLIDPGGEVNVPIVSHPRSDEHPTWSPDGRLIAFHSTRRGRADIYVVDANGGNLRRLTQAGGNNTSPSWGPHRR